MSARKSLGAMLGTTIEPAGVKLAVSPHAATPVNTIKQSATATAPIAPTVRASIPVAPAAGEVPRWLTFERKETRQRQDQIAWVEATRKDLNKRRGRAGERLTDNTLLRVALDLLRLHAAELEGVTEDELRASLGIELDEHGAPIR